jgi:DNA (cytosine-5)-methyltransferase 1
LRALSERGIVVPSVLDIFAAPGGLSAGFREAGYWIAAAIDNDFWGCKTLEYNLRLGGTQVLNSDVETVVADGSVDVVVGGPPCQSFSRVGRAKINSLRRMRKREQFVDSYRNRLYVQFVRLVKSVQPQFFVMENVPDVLSFQNGEVVDQIFDDFSEIGYRTEAQVLNAADFGVPQVRKRAVLIGNRLGLPNPFPKKTYFRTEKEARLAGVRGEWKPYHTVFDAISDLPSLKPGEGIDGASYPSTPSLTDYQRWARQSSRSLFNHVARRHSERDQRLFKLLNPGEKMVDLPPRMIPYRSDIFPDKIKKQSWDRPSSAILAHMQKDGLMYVHPDRSQARSFSPREAARLQSFRDRYRFVGPMTQQFKQIGNSVPPLAAMEIALSLKPYLQTRENESRSRRGRALRTIARSTTSVVDSSSLLA